MPLLLETPNSNCSDTVALLDIALSFLLSKRKVIEHASVCITTSIIPLEFNYTIHY
jgi:hypothetical protein